MGPLNVSLRDLFIIFSDTLQVPDKYKLSTSHQQILTHLTKRDMPHSLNIDKYEIVQIIAYF